MGQPAASELQHVGGLGRSGHETRYFHPEIQFDEKLWDDMLTKCAECGVNMIVFDLGDVLSMRVIQRLRLRMPGAQVACAARSDA